MGQSTEISWCDSTINPTVGCDGCELHRAGQPESHCYAASLVARYCGSAAWPETFDQPKVFADRFLQALKWRDLSGQARPEKPWLDGMPRLVFCCDLGDPFSESLPTDWLTPWLQRLAASPHRWLFLTKRAARARQFWSEHVAPANVWQGVSVTGPETKARIDTLRQIDVKVRYVSAEPLLGALGELDLTGIHQVIVGGESGPRFRPFEQSWAREIRDACVAQSTAFYFKQTAGRRSGTAPYLVEEDGARWQWRQIPGNLIPPTLAEAIVDAHA
jgi:Bacteriophage protein gp37